MLDEKEIWFLSKHTGGKWELNLSNGRVDIVGGFDFSWRKYKKFGVKFGKVSWSFNCSGNDLETLEGAPQEVEGRFLCSYNSLKTLEGAPRKVGEGFWCHNNPLRSLEGAPEIIGGEFRSDLLYVPASQWSIFTLATMFLESSGVEKDLLGTLVSPEALQKRINKNPEGAAVEMKSLAGLPEYKSLKWPAGLRSEVDLLSDLDRIGL